VSFLDRVRSLPRLGVGVSTEYGAGEAPGALDLGAAAEAGLADFLELGVELAVGLDAHAEAWIAAGRPTTWHFLDLNLDDPADLDPDWLAGTRAGLAHSGAAWVCGDAGLWHLGPRDRGHMLLLPPVLEASRADAIAAGVRALRAAVGREVLPENPPGQVYVGELPLLEFYARVAEGADTGLLLDVAHLAIYQHTTGRAPLDGLDDFPLDRVVEIHVAGGTLRDHRGHAWVEDDHSVTPIEATWRILDHVLPRAPNLKAIVVECERNPLHRARPLLERVRSLAW